MKRDRYAERLRADCKRAGAIERGRVDAMSEALHRVGELRAKGVDAVLLIRPHERVPHRYEVVVLEEGK